MIAPCDRCGDEADYIMPNFCLCPRCDKPRPVADPPVSREFVGTWEPDIELDWSDLDDTDPDGWTAATTPAQMQACTKHVPYKDQMPGSSVVRFWCKFCGKYLRSHP